MFKNSASKLKNHTRCYNLLAYFCYETICVVKQPVLFCIINVTANVRFLMLHACESFLNANIGNTNAIFGFLNAKSVIRNWKLAFKHQKLMFKCQSFAFMKMNPGQKSLKVYAQPFFAHSNKFDQRPILYKKTRKKIKLYLKFQIMV